MTDLIHTTMVLEKALTQLELNRKFLKEVFTSEFSLEDRWEFFLKAIPLLDTGVYSDGHLEVLDPDGYLYDDFNCERHQTKTYNDMDETIRSYIDDINIDSVDEWEQKASAKGMRWKAKYDEWREAVLAEGLGGFTYDW
jgi:hypothetical protein